MIGIVHNLHPGTLIWASGSAELYLYQLEARMDEYSPLRSVMPHVRGMLLARSATLWEGDDLEQPEQLLGAIVTNAEAECVKRYVSEDFCGLCGRYTDHRGEH